tara:strand:- start:902 stop:1348 length:447 start_codon:yes stop_codon:yes gene_type:complete
LNKIVAIVLLISFPLLAFADDTPKIKPMNKGEVAPFAGVLFNSTAVAQSIAEKEYNAEQCRLRTEHLEQKEKAKCDLLVSTVKVEVDFLQKKYDSILKIKDEEVNRLQKIALEKPNKNSHWWFAGGMVAGIVTSVVIFYAAVEIGERD